MRLVGLATLALTALAVRPPVPLGLDHFRPTPPDNPLTPATIVLGRRLFHDRRLSASGRLSCATCHDPARAFTIDRPVPLGAGGVALRRNAPTLINRAYGTSFFWDGRASSLERQVRQPLLDSREMAGSPDAILRVIANDRGYRRAFASAFGRPPQFDDVARALASYVRTILSGGSRYDRFRNGERSALSAEQQLGMRMFLGKGRCWTCHSGMNLTDEQFHNTGVAFRDGSFLDAGRAGVTVRPEDRGAFKTPTLRDVARTAPYMHDGSLPTLAAVVDHYDRGGTPNPALDPLVQPIGFSAAEKRALVAFLGALTGRIQDGR